MQINQDNLFPQRRARKCEWKTVSNKNKFRQVPNRELESFIYLWLKIYILLFRIHGEYSMRIKKGKEREKKRKDTGVQANVYNAEMIKHEYNVVGAT